MAKDEIKYTRQELKEDEFVSFATMVLERIVKYRYQIIAVFAVIVFLVSAAEAWKWWSIRRNAAASNLFFEATEGMDDKDDQDLTSGNEKKMKAVKSLEKLISQYSSSDVAPLAILQIASTKYDLSDNDGAIEYADKFLKKISGNDSLQQVGMQIKGLALLNKGDAAAAAVIFMKIVDLKDIAGKDQVLFNLGVALEQMGDKKGAADTFRRISAETPKSQIRDLADSRASELDPR